jgi:DinB family protein
VQRPSSPDPVSEPKAYQEHLLGLLGADDPAEVQGETPNTWRKILGEVTDVALVRPEPAEWSAIECLGHAVDAEVVSTARYRWILAHDEPSLIGYDQDLWVEALHAGQRDEPWELLALFEPLRAANIALWRRASRQDRARVGIHAERGPESFDLLFRMLAGHDRFHIAQAVRALKSVAGT